MKKLVAPTYREFVRQISRLSLSRIDLLKAKFPANHLNRGAYLTQPNNHLATALPP